MQNAECKMQNEQRLINGTKAQAVLVNMAEHLMEAGNPEMAGAVGYAAEVIGKQRAVDAVVVEDKELLKAIKLLMKQYAKSKAADYVHSPVAHALFHTWKQVEEKRSDG